MVEGWDVVDLSGISLYHTTKPDYAISILTDGIRNVQSAWGNAALGNGFYTHKDKWGSANYFQPSRDYPTVILEFAASPAVGQKVPRPVASADLSGNDPVENNAFLVNGEDEDEVKWHSGDSLQFVRGWVSKADPESRSDAGYTEYNDRQALINALLG